MAIVSRHFRQIESKEPSLFRLCGKKVGSVGTIVRPSSPGRIPTYKAFGKIDGQFSTLFAYIFSTLFGGWQCLMRCVGRKQPAKAIVSNAAQYHLRDKSMFAAVSPEWTVDPTAVAMIPRQERVFFPPRKEERRWLNQTRFIPIGATKTVLSIPFV